MDPEVGSLALMRVAVFFLMFTQSCLGLLAHRDGLAEDSALLQGLLLHQTSPCTG